MAAVTVKNFEMSSHSMDTLTAKREARRRKILENAESRLKKLTGVEHKSNVSIDDFRPINYECNDTSSTQTNVHDDSPPYNGILPTQSSEIRNLGPNIPSELLQNSSQQHRSSVKEHKGYKFCALFGIAFIANILLMFSNGAFGRTGNDMGCSMIFIPFFGYELVDFFLNRNNITENSILQLLLVINMKSDTLKNILLYIPYLTHFTQDLCVYFFMFIVVNQILELTFLWR